MTARIHRGSLVWLGLLGSACDRAAEQPAELVETSPPKSADRRPEPEPAKPEPVKPEPVKPQATSAPTTALEATRQLQAWLDDPDAAPVPALLAAPGEVELAVYCGPCTDDPPPSISKTAGIEAMTRSVAQLRGESSGGAWDFSGDPTCNENCCSYPAYESEGSGNISLDKVCMALDPAGKPTAYTRIDAAAH